MRYGYCEWLGCDMEEDSFKITQGLRGTKYLPIIEAITPGWALDVGLITPPRKNLLLRNHGEGQLHRAVASEEKNLSVCVCVCVSVSKNPALT
jgi:hypothetical protein